MFELRGRRPALVDRAAVDRAEQARGRGAPVGARARGEGRGMWGEEVENEFVGWWGINK